MARNFDIIVIGVGSMGAAVCWQLARRNVKVLGIEQFPIPNDQGSAAGLTRAIRKIYYEHPDYVQLSTRAYALWDELEQQTGETVLTTAGGLWVGPPNCELIKRYRQAAQQHDLPHEVLTHKEINERFPQFSLPDDVAGFYEPGAGYLHAERAIGLFAKQARKQGSDLHVEEKVLSWQATGSGVEVKTDRDTYSAAKLILTAGPWSGQLLRNMGIDLLVTRQTVMWVSPQNPEQFRVGKFPVWAIDTSSGKNEGPHYGFPTSPDLPGLKIAWHHPGPRTDPENVDRSTSEEERDGLLRVLKTYLPGGYGEMISMCTCMYTYSPDGDFVIDRHPEYENVLLACGFSGHGFKFAGVIGEILADLVTTGSTSNPIEFLSLGRFSKA